MAPFNYIKEDCVEIYKGTNLKKNRNEKVLVFDLDETFPIIEHCDKVHYVDFTSLYPDTNKNGIYPVGHPEIFTNIDGTDIDMYQGLIKCKVLPPQNLFHPVLPMHRDEKLVFSLCYTCDKYQIDNCNHSIEERSIIGTWTHLELQEALNNGYEILKIFEVHHFSEFSSDIYKSYVNTWLKNKQESSGFPDGIETDEQKQDYIQKYYEHEDIMLDIANILHNPGRRSTSKLLLNSLWGRLAMRNNHNQDVCISDPTEYYKLLTDDTIEVINCNIQTLIKDGESGLIHVVYKQKIDFIKVSPSTNIYHGVFTTSQARLKLFKLLNGLGESVKYFDTDSVIFLQKAGEPYPECAKLGNYLGELTSELAPDDYITHFVATAPKEYAYITKNDEKSTKIKGFSLNYESGLVIKHETMLDIVDSGRDDKELSLEIPTMMFDKNKKNQTITTNNTTKKYTFSYNSRKIDWTTYKTYPFGFRNT